MTIRLCSRTETLQIRGLRYHVRHWGNGAAPKVFFLHGWMDCSPTFQFVVDALKHDWHVIAPDWRGFGASQWLSRPYWFPDYYADLDALLRHYTPEEPARLVGHSMGASIGASYGAARPERVSQLVMMDFLGLPPPTIDGPTQLAQWLDAVDENSPPRLRSYPDTAALARRLRAANERLTEARALWLAEHCSCAAPDGGVQLACDPWHKVPSPVPYRVEEALAAWRKIASPVLMLVADKGFIQERFGHQPEEYQRRLDGFRQVHVARIEDAGHNVQHDQPLAVAAAIEHFLRR